MTTADSQVTVIQADRDAAADLIVCHGGWPGFPSDFCSGRADGNSLTQAFARHRLAAEKRERAACAEVARNPGFIQARDTEWDEGVNYAKRYIAAAIIAQEQG